MPTLPLFVLAGLAGYTAARRPPKVPDAFARRLRAPMDAVGFLVYATVIGGRLPERDVLTAVADELRPPAPAEQTPEGEATPEVYERPVRLVRRARSVSPAVVSRERATNLVEV